MTMLEGQKDTILSCNNLPGYYIFTNLIIVFSSNSLYFNVQFCLSLHVERAEFLIGGKLQVCQIE